MKRNRISVALLTAIFLATSSPSFAQQKDAQEASLEAALQKAKEFEASTRNLPVSGEAQKMVAQAQAALEKYRKDRAVRDVAAKAVEDKKKKDEAAAAAALAIVNEAIAKKAKDDAEKAKKERENNERGFAQAKKDAEDQLKAKRENDERGFAQALMDTDFGKSVNMDMAEARAIISGTGDFNKASRVISAHFVKNAPEVLKSNVEVNLFNKTLTRVPLGICESMRTALPLAIEAQLPVLFKVPGTKTAFEQAFKKSYTCSPGYLQAYKNYAGKDPNVEKVMKKYDPVLETILAVEAQKYFSSLASEAKTQAVVIAASAGSHVENYVKEKLVK